MTMLTGHCAMLITPIIMEMVRLITLVNGTLSVHRVEEEIAQMKNKKQ